MYIPRKNAEEDLDTLHAFIEAHPFATMVTSRDGLFATHLPLILQPDAGPFGRLEGHIARANPHHALLREPAQALVIFTGAQAHVSPSWYPSKADDGRVVPTWNYVAVHAYGEVRLMDDEALLREHVSRLTARHERARGSEWTTNDPPDGYVAQQLRAIAGVEVVIARLEGKWKMSQNRSDADRAGVVEGLRRTGAGEDADVAEIVAERLRDDQGA